MEYSMTDDKQNKHKQILKDMGFSSKESNYILYHLLPKDLKHFCKYERQEFIDEIRRRSNRQTYDDQFAFFFCAEPEAIMEVVEKVMAKESKKGFNYDDIYQELQRIGFTETDIEDVLLRLPEKDLAQISQLTIYEILLFVRTHGHINLKEKASQKDIILIVINAIEKFKNNKNPDLTFRNNNAINELDSLLKRTTKQTAKCKGQLQNIKGAAVFVNALCILIAIVAFEQNLRGISGGVIVIFLIIFVLANIIIHGL